MTPRATVAFAITCIVACPAQADDIVLSPPAGGGVVITNAAGTTPRYRFTGAETYVRAAIIVSNGKCAWTQPVFRDGRDRRR